MRYIIQWYARYAIYEPAEGGYYYEGMIQANEDTNKTIDDGGM